MKLRDTVHAELQKLDLDDRERIKTLAMQQRGLHIEMCAVLGLDVDDAFETQLANVALAFILLEDKETE